MVVLRQMAVESGYMPRSFLSKWQEVERLGQQFRAEMLSSLLATAREGEEKMSSKQLLKDAYTHCIGGE